MGYGTSYTQMKTLDVGMAAAQNAGGSNLGELGIGMMGMSAMQQQQQMQQLLQQQQLAQQQAAAAAQPQPSSAAAGASGAMPDVMTPAQAAAFVQVTEADIVAAIEAGDLKARKIGTAYRITRTSLEEFLSG
jgi:excisionase family DNA binding protein